MFADDAPQAQDGVRQELRLVFIPLCTPNPPTNIVDFRESDSSTILI